jgi:hypothetical protein
MKTTEIRPFPAPYARRSKAGALVGSSPISSPCATRKKIDPTFRPDNAPYLKKDSFPRGKTPGRKEGNDL